MRLAVFALMALAAPLAAQESQPPLPEFLVGSWAESREYSRSEEAWISGPARMLGTSRQFTGSTLDSRESLTIERTATGLALIAQPAGAQPVVFLMTEQRPDAIEFANPAHDYPQRIRYWREGDKLLAEIALLDGSRAVSWVYEPVS